MIDNLPYRQRKTSWWIVLIDGVVAFVIGILLLLSPIKAMAILVQLVGIYLFIIGLVTLLRLFSHRSHWGWKLISGIAGILGGLVLIRNPLWGALLVPTAALLYLAILAVIRGIVEIIHGMQSKDIGVAGMGILTLCLAIALFIVAPLLALALPIVLGLIGVIGGILLVILAFNLRRRAHIAQPLPGAPQTY